MALPSLYDLRRSGSRFPMDQELKLEYEVRATRGYKKLQVSPRFRSGGSRSRKLRVQEVSVGLPWGVVHAPRDRDSF